MLAKVSIGGVLLGLMIWGGFALYYQVHHLALRSLLILVYVGLLAAGFIQLFSRSTSCALWIAIGLAVLCLGGWWFQIKPSMEREWADDVAHTSYGQVRGDKVIMHHVRNFAWHSKTDYDIRWESREYDLNQLNRVDMVLSYWMGPAIAHTLVSFGFTDGRHLVFSVEIRKERHEKFSSIGGFFKQFEMAIIAADERDIIRTRTNIRQEDVYLYEVDMPPEARRDLFLAYLDQANQLQHQARFYNTLTANCTTIIYQMVDRIVDGLPLNYRLLLSGYLPEYVHELGALVPGYSVGELREQGHINARALASADDPLFSENIRKNVPGLPE